jgi:voltage-gated potassium channel
VVVAIGFGVLTYTLLQLLSFTLEGRLSNAVVQRQHRRRVTKMEGHFILCGFGRVGSEIARIFTRQCQDFVIVDINAESLQRAASEGYTTIGGDAAEASTLEAAGVDRAAGLIAAVDRDETNIYVTLSARVLNPDLFIVARANRRDAESKLRLAGASRIISPYAIGGSRMASLAMRPTAVEFVDTVLFADNSELVLEDFRIDNGPWTGRTVANLVDEKDDITVLALKRDGAMRFRPLPETPFHAGDEIVVAGSPDGIRAVDQRLRRT